ncbi:sporulation integral membrane protein YtvI [Metabacillus sp. B2-18]|uniref:sporulation integral membrane protein YtvI n=1 Tax=Metabacillus sp. B2-18 TaxID=2897333 RepID=UPI001E4A70F7|nr:sporulation integral membrane protein YtvI [Metabacillus sp. B2-18]UGB32541.1 sporulation integral membrane protein YtvI [Metabacillus sp. B2-18]
MTTILNKRILLTIVSIIIVGVILFYILPISVPLIVAFITALFLEPAIRLLQRRGTLNRHLSVLIVFLLFLILISVSGYILTTKVVGEVVQIADNAPSYINEITKVWENFEDDISNTAQDLPPIFVEEVSNQVTSFLQKTRLELTSYVNIENVKAIFTNIPNYLVNLIVYLIALFLFMLELPRLKTKAYSYLTDKTAEKVTFMISRLTYVVMGFIKAQFLVSIIIFVASLIGLLFIAPEIALIMSLIIWIIDVIPLIGSIIIMGPWTLYHVVTGDMAIAAKLGVLTIILLVIRRTIEPKVMGTHIGLSPLATLISMYLGLKLFGVLGFFIGPMILIVYNSAREAGLIKIKFKL